MEAILGAVLSRLGIYYLHNEYFRVQNDQVENARARNSHSEEYYDMMSDFKHLSKTAHPSIVNAITRSNPIQKHDPDLIDYVVIPVKTKFPTKQGKQRIDIGYAFITRKHVEMTAKREFKRSTAGEKLALYREGLLGQVSEDGLRILEQEAEVENESIRLKARQESEDAEFLFIGPEDFS